MAPLEVMHAYRHLYRDLLRAVQYSKPARYSGLRLLRQAFRDPNATTLDASGAEQTGIFLRAAAASRGLEHRVLRTVLRVEWERRRAAPTWHQILRQKS